ncbi:MAG: efflux RND transporter periplasmic adaptor subunit [Xanthomonadales bacterium]|jgi:HlyD family secretion protein|nr:efflux RND transporter periplasmic adaptor subunit [Xanthomonadales bacterium]
MIAEPAAQDRPLIAPRRLPLGWIAGGTALLLLAGTVAMGWAGAGRSIDGERLRIATVERGLLVRDAQVSGQVVAAVSPTLYAPAAVTVNLRTQAGAEVTQGEVLAVLESPELAAEHARENASLRALGAEVARARIEAQRARLSALRTADEARLTLKAAERDAERTATACTQQVIPRAQCLAYTDAVEAAQVRARHSEADVDLEVQRVALELQGREEALARQQAVVAELDRRVAALELRSPVNGVVGSVAVADRSVVPANAPLMTVLDLSRLDVELEVPESYADELSPGLRVEVRIGAQTLAGELASIAPEVLERQVLARVRLLDPTTGLRQRQRVSARVLIEEKPDVLMLARGPFVENHGGREAWVLEGSEAVRRPIRLGATAVAAVEVLDGLKPGDRVVIAGSDLFEDAERIRVND